MEFTKIDPVAWCRGPGVGAIGQVLKDRKFDSKFESDKHKITYGDALYALFKLFMWYPSWLSQCHSDTVFITTPVMHSLMHQDSIVGTRVYSMHGLTLYLLTVNTTNISHIQLHNDI